MDPNKRIIIYLHESYVTIDTRIFSTFSGTKARLDNFGTTHRTTRNINLLINALETNFSNVGAK